MNNIRNLKIALYSFYDDPDNHKINVIVPEGFYKNLNLFQ
jgi:hypothetical protein